MSKKEKIKKSPIKVVSYIAGSIAVCTIATIVVPSIIDKGSSYYYKKTAQKDDTFDASKDVIVRRKTNKDV